MSLETFDLSTLPQPGDENEIVRAFAANPAFQAAEWEELTTEGDPFRRPVRPDDLDWLDYTAPMPVENALKLSALLGHRMLRNIYDTDHLYLPPRPSEAASAHGAQFYSVRNRVLGELARPILERHLFTLLDEGREPLLRNDLTGVLDEVRDYGERRFAERPAFSGAVQSTKGRKESATFVLLQMSAFRPATHAAVGRAALGEYYAAHPGLRTILLDDYRGWAESGPAYTELLASADLTTTTGAYWQLYLGSSLGRGNHLQRLGADQRNVFALLGALVHEKIDRAANAGHFAEIFAEGFGYSGDFFAADRTFTGADAVRLTETLLRPLTEQFGKAAIEGFHRGFADARWFAGLWDEDLATQVSWADRIEEHQEKAEKIDQHLSNENIEVDLDTFVESNEETSTTHVHDDHRLVMIEAGQMHFWNNVTHKIELNEGDKLLIPQSRLHGSTVLSGECTYHQPIIPDELLQQFN